MSKLQKAFDLLIIIWYMVIILFCVSSFIQIFIGSKFGRESEVFDFALSFNYLLLVYKSEKK
jgi:hypothetical protein